MFSEDEIQKISKLIFENLVKHYDRLAEEENDKDYVLDHEDIIKNALTEEDLLYLQLERLYTLEYKYVDKEEYLKANIILNKINKIKEKLKSL